MNKFLRISIASRWLEKHPLILSSMRKFIWCCKCFWAKNVNLPLNSSIYCRLIILISIICSKSRFFSCFSFNHMFWFDFRALATKIALDGQGRLVSRETGKIILPYEHFANAVILKHMAGPGGMHLSMDATVKSVFDSYSCGKDNFGFDRDFIIEVVNSCPSSSCRYFKGQSLSSFDVPVPPQHSSNLPPQHQNFPPMPVNVNSMPNLPNPPPRQSPSSALGLMQMQPPIHDPTAALKQHRGIGNQQFTQQMMQNRVMSQSMESLEKQRVLQQLDKKHYETVAAIVQANNSLGLTNQPMVPTMPPQMHKTPQQPPPPQIDYSRWSLYFVIDYSYWNNFELIFSMQRRPSYDGIETYSAASYATSNRELLNSSNNWTTTASVPQISTIDAGIAGQEKIVRAFAELMKNMAKMKAFIRPSMVKPYGKQSENLQKALMDSIQIVQTLRNFLPKPHISISNWKNSESEIVQIQ